MPPARHPQVHRPRPVPTVAFGDDATWPVARHPAASDSSLASRDRLSWPTAIAVTAGLSAGLWLGLAWLVSAVLS